MVKAFETVEIELELELELEIYFSSKYRVENLQVLVSYIIYTLFWLL